MLGLDGVGYHFLIRSMSMSDTMSGDCQVMFVHSDMSNMSRWTRDADEVVRQVSKAVSKCV